MEILTSKQLQHLELGEILAFLGHLCLVNSSFSTDGGLDPYSLYLNKLFSPLVVGIHFSVGVPLAVCCACEIILNHSHPFLPTWAYSVLFEDADKPEGELVQDPEAPDHFSIASELLSALWGMSCWELLQGDGCREHRGKCWRN